MERVAQQSISSYLDALASKAPTPGGGGAAALTAGQGAALLGMVVRFTVGRKKSAAHEDTLQAILARADGLRRQALQQADEDAAAFAAVGACYRMPKQTDAEKSARKAALDQALYAAARVPLNVMQDVLLLLQDAQVVGKVGNRNVLTDVMVAAHLLRAAALSCEINVRINMKFVTPAAPRADVLAQMENRKRAILDLAESVLAICDKRLKLAP